MCEVHESAYFGMHGRLMEKVDEFFSLLKSFLKKTAECNHHACEYPNTFLPFAI